MVNLSEREATSYNERLNSWENFQAYGSDENTSGEKVVAYDRVNKVWSRSYVPRELLAKRRDEVGYILIFSRTQKTGHAYYGTIDRSVEYSGQLEVVDVMLRDYKTGELIGQKTFETQMPNSIRSGSSIYEQVSVPDVEEWVRLAIRINGHNKAA